MRRWNYHYDAREIKKTANNNEKENCNEKIMKGLKIGSRQLYVKDTLMIRIGPDMYRRKLDQ